MLNMYTTNMSQTSYEISTDNPKWYESRVPIDMWYKRAWTYQGVGVSEALRIIWEGMMRWQRRKLMRV